MGIEYLIVVVVQLWFSVLALFPGFIDIARGRPLRLAGERTIGEFLYSLDVLLYSYVSSDAM